MATVDFREAVFVELRQYLIDLFDCPVTQGRQNNSPIPEDGILMTILYNKGLDWTSTYFDGDLQEETAQRSMQCTIQLDFFGELGGARAEQVCVLWKSIHATERLLACQPLYAGEPKNLEFVNEAKQYEQRYMLEISLQYNPFYTYNQDSGTEVPKVQIINPQSLGD